MIPFTDMSTQLASTSIQPAPAVPQVPAPGSKPETLHNPEEKTIPPPSMRVEEPSGPISAPQISNDPRGAACLELVQAGQKSE